jgi:HK97 family phage portal protein
MGRVVDFLKRAAAGPQIERVEPLEGTNMSLWNSQIPAFWQDTFGTPWYGDANLAERVWVANRCQQLNAQQIASMPLEFHGPPVPDTEPAWLTSPDPNWYPNGIGDALHAIVVDIYAYGFCCLYVTDRYASGFARTWTVLPSGSVQIKLEDGQREYKLGESVLDPSRVVQIDRNPGTAVHGTSALQAYAQQAWGLLAAGNQSLAVSDGGVPRAILKRQAGIFTEENADALLAKWREKIAQKGSGEPIILPPELEYEQLSFNPSDLALLETQEWNARVLATAYGVPSMLLNMALQGGLAYQNPAALGESWWRFELRPTATRIANALSEQMLPRGQWVWFDAADTFAPITTENDPQAAQDQAAAPAQQQPPGLTAVAGGAQ